MEVTHPRWRVRGQRQRSPAAASTILHLHNNHTLEENRRCGNYNQQPTRATQPHIIYHPPQQPYPGADMEMWSILSTTDHRHNQKQTTTYNHPTPPPSSTTTTPRNRHGDVAGPINNQPLAQPTNNQSTTGWWIKTGGVANTTDN